MARPVNTRMMLKAASFYCFGENGRRLTKTEIANRLGTHTTQVSRWIDEAFERNIVRLCYDPPRAVALEQDLTRHFGLRRAIIVPNGGNYELTRRQRGQATAHYFDEQVKHHSTVAISGGTALYEMAIALPTRDRNIDIYPAAIIGRGPTITHIDPGVLVSIIWAKSGGRPPTRTGDRRSRAQAHHVTVLPYSPTPMPETGTKGINARAASIRKEREALLNLPIVRQVFEGMQNADIVFAGCSPVDIMQEYSQFTHYSTINLVNALGVSADWLKQSKVVGQIASSFVDASGTPVPECEFFLSIGADRLRQMAADESKQVVLTAGEYSDHALRAAMNGKLCNVLIADETTDRKSTR